MGLLDDYKNKRILQRLTEEQLYTIVHEELEQGILRKGLWLKAIADSRGDERNAMGNYIKLRFKSLQDELNLIMKTEQAQHAIQEKHREDAAEKTKRNDPKQYIHITCQAVNCKTINRIPKEKSIINVRCGKCGHQLYNNLTRHELNTRYYRCLDCNYIIKDNELDDILLCIKCGGRLEEKP